MDINCRTTHGVEINGTNKMYVHLNENTFQKYKNSVLKHDCLCTHPVHNIVPMEIGHSFEQHKHVALYLCLCGGSS